MTVLIQALRTPSADPGAGQVRIGDAVSRVDGRDKVTGQARYAAEYTPDAGASEAGLLYGVVVSGAIAKGHIRALHTEAAMAVPGVVDVIWHENRPKIRSFDIFYKDMTAPGGSPYRPLYDNEVHYSGQPVALVVADTFEAARHAAALVRVEYDVQPHETYLLEHQGRAHKPSRLKAGYTPPPDVKGHPDEVWDKAAVKIEASYYSGVEHHNPLEMFATTVIHGADGHLTIYDKTQSSQNSRWYVSHVFGLSKDKVTVRNPYVGGAFGSGLRPQYQLPLAVMAALKLERSVRVVLTRQQMFTFGHRPETQQRLKLSADADGTLTSIVHEAVAETSRYEDYVEVVVNWSGELYACEHIRLGYKIVDLDHASPMDMRAPGAAHGVHALEVAMDELSYALKMDPLALRLKNYAEIDPSHGLPYSTKELRECYLQGAQRFGWDQRPLEPGSMREGRELIGWGMATGMWDAMQMFARASAVLHADGSLVVSSAASDIGTGTYTAMCIIAAEALGLPLEKVRFQLGDSTLPVAPIEGGSSHVATVGSAVAGVCEKLQKTVFKRAREMAGSPLASARLADVEFVDGVVRLRNIPGTSVPLTQILAGIEQPLEEKYLMLPNMLKQMKFQRATHSAVFVEVRVDPEFGTVRVTRVVSAVAAGRIINAKTARSQIIGGVVWGIGQALHEETHCDHRLGRFMNHNLSEYHVSVNADIHDIDVIFVKEDDRIVSRIGAKGVGEIGQVGVAAAVCNAIYHATGQRVRSTPMTPEKVMRG
ncbi:xanthine dehydrogenase YagR molybdenum-binding subunit [Duganella sp. 3397]|uniref:xanthine dehydrogenase family protein molybdopterin-binding subunit n=1 Tax=Duganella sp. 3397 TaxID=2817732 RepID=UPI002857C9C3|nr:xanthine dehydrogenase family protein molybdopterin-binding subunit [Duganella sp. 3397]MDR7049076.1 xanthine dehydrogenase YagR molybdenum-binding subunit [Duganella sp. 3397]